MSDSQLTPISQLGEFGLIERLAKKFPLQRPDSVLKGIGDDAAVVLPGTNTVQVFSTDLLLEGVHFDLSFAPLQHLGYKSVVVNLSDIVAMNARPYGITVSLGMSNRFTVEAVEAFYEGVKLACEGYGIDLLGGDTTSSQQGLVISVTAFGEVEREKVVYRDGAAPNHLICVSGDLGAAYAGLLILQREKLTYRNQPEAQPDLNDYDYVVGRNLKPEARADLIARFNELEFIPSAMIDVSDGLASEIHHICKQSGVGATIYANKIPVDHQAVKVAEEFGIGPSTFALNGGEDYELLFTMPVAKFDLVRELPDVSILGRTTDEPDEVNLILDDGSVVALPASGFQHFSATEQA